MTDHPLLEGMNRQQVAAISAGAGPVLVLAGPGSGKTSVLTRRIAWLIREHQVPHHRIMAVTFTNKAAGEMRSRVEALLGASLRGLQIGTFHKVCMGLLREDATLLGFESDWKICSPSQQYWILYHLVKKSGIDRDEFSPSKLKSAISIAKNNAILPEDYVAHDDVGTVVAQVYPEYERELRESNRFDLDDLLLKTLVIARDFPSARARYQAEFNHVLVDEYQDSNSVQFELLQYFAEPERNLL